jgi:hypothetical protein
MKLIIWLLVAMLLIFHQDFWNWNDSTTVNGFLPIGMAYHIGVSIAAAIVWLIACTFAWPKGIDEFDDEVDTTKGGEA